MSSTVRKELGESGTVYYEPARGYASTWLLLAVLLAGFGVDLALGGGRAHLFAWIGAVVVVVGIDLVTVRAARNLRSITVTGTELRVGGETVLREQIVAFEHDFGAFAPVLGRAAGEGLPRGTTGVGVHLADGTQRVVPTRHPNRLVDALGLADALPVIRAAEADEADAVVGIQTRALTLFTVSGYALPPGGGSVDALHEAEAVLVAGRPPVGAVVIDELDGLAHIKQIGVLPGRMRKGIGSALLEAACTWAVKQGYPAIVIVVFADVPWGGAFYAARGFVEVAELTPELAELRDWERSAGMDAVGRRVVMRRQLNAG